MGIQANHYRAVNYVPISQNWPPFVGAFSLCIGGVSSDRFSKELKEYRKIPLFYWTE
jgi:hypothetical protein